MTDHEPEERTRAHPRRSTARANALKVALGYAALGSVWIIASDEVAEVVEAEGFGHLQTIKGLAYVLVSGVLVYLLALRGLRATEHEEALERLELTRGRWSARSTASARPCSSSMRTAA